jgi:hypothetical protein
VVQELRRHFAPQASSLKPQASFYSCRCGRHGYGSVPDEDILCPDCGESFDYEWSAPPADPQLEHPEVYLDRFRDLAVRNIESIVAHVEQHRADLTLAEVLDVVSDLTAALRRISLRGLRAAPKTKNLCPSAQSAVPFTSTEAP